MARGAVILIEKEQVAMIERVRQGKTYYLFPGGTVEVGETIEQAAVREAKEELGLEVRLGPLLAVVDFAGNLQHYFQAERIGGIFGTGDGAEYASLVSSEEGSYRAVWLPRAQLTEVDARPHVVAAAVHSGALFLQKSVLRVRE